MDTLTPQERSERMSRVKGRNTKPELVVRRLVTALGHRYRLHYGKVPGKPDLAFPGRRKAIFVHGCFWHRHPDPNCPLARLPKSRLDFWLPKLEANRERDLAKRAQLEALGWSVLEIWECELTRSPEQLTERIMDFLGPSRSTMKHLHPDRDEAPAAGA
ncbi:MULTISPECIES: very short patch repair endonuclease [Corallococcus]|uniref:very short patch repair endonuclease n=1 Tax=Corallococcus TaxID=83461 RepID=UPI000EA1AFAF|nr:MULTISPECIES: very short patch repair endonuclease [Corallococcus]NRD53465.1 DNA mismatch endonuclease Vsr [Corallococcus exiguus]RKH27700.1 DNA mismatch endonuclease Vsr [Corallococcus sp. CA041A]